MKSKGNCSPRNPLKSRKTGKESRKRRRLASRAAATEPLDRFATLAMTAFVDLTLAALARREKSVGDARLLKEGERVCRHSRRHSEKSGDIDGIVDIHPDSRLADDERIDPAGSRGMEMRIKAVLAEAQRNGVGRRADDGVRSEIIMRGHDRERRRGLVRREGRGDLG